MKKWKFTLFLLAALIHTNTFCFGSSISVGLDAILLAAPLNLSDSVIVDTIAFEDMNDEYSIRQFKINGEIVQMDIDRKGSYTVVDYIIWDMDKNGRLEAIAVYDPLEERYDYHLIEEDLAASDLLEFQVQLEDIGFPSFYNSSGIPKAIYKSKEHQPILNYIK